MSNYPDGLDPYVRAQASARQKPAVVKIEFLNFRSQFPSGLVVAVEGDADKIVYSYWIKRVSSDLAYEFFVCGGKRGVRKLENSLNLDLSDSGKDVVFFVDRDFDDLENFLCTDNVFMLDRYSIENYLVDTNVLDETLKVAFPGSSDRAMRQAICTIFQSDYLTFLNTVSEINRKIFISRRLGIDIDDCIPNSLTNIASIDLGNVVAAGVSVDELFPVTIEASAELITGMGREFSALEPSLRYRGKFIYKFFRCWLDRLCEEYKRNRIGVFTSIAHSDGKIKFDEMRLGSLACRSVLPDNFESFVAQMAA